MTTPPYRLATDVFACRTGESLVFLDLCRDRYFFLDRRNTAAALQLLEDFRETDKTQRQWQAAADTKDTMSVVQGLMARGLLQLADGPVEEKAGPVCVQASKSMLAPRAHRQSATIDAVHWMAFFRASLAASARLRWYPIHRTVRRTRRRKKALRGAGQSKDHLAGLVSVFHRLRPFYPRKYLCLYDSLALLEYLSLFGRFPQWVFGVRTEPFSAHCWIQQDDCVLNDTVERVREYTPIMIV